QTPPCADALVAAGIARCVGAIEDPDPRVSGRGFAMLRGAGIAVDVGLLADKAREANAGFLKRVTEGLPLVTVKLATSLDGRIATRSGDSKWVTGEPAREFGHLLRATHDVIAVGSGTILSDDPELTCRLPGLADRSPPRVIFDRRGRVTGGAKILSMPAPPVWLVTEDAHKQLRDNSKNPLEFIEIKTEHGGSEWLKVACRALAERGVTRILVEGGATLATGFLNAGLVDRLYWFRAPIAIGEDGLAGLGSLSVDRLADSIGFRRLDTRILGNDVLELYGRPA
ncbi:MAG: bifunctional diaminohydroxyphosphoribosylaminopyrimidine deaminase/5-amino-6-(5-phosphoribosylamino)uracil reductase RibD, partial [Dongiaceae bacterium]